MWGRGTGAAVAACALALTVAGASASADTVVSLTFDDGLADQYDARPMLEELGLNATFFVNTGRLGRSGYLTTAQLVELQAAGHEIGGHTVNHARLPAVEADEAQR